MLPITLAVFVGFLTIGLPLPVLPLHLHYTLGMSPVVVGIAVGAQFAAALLSRAWAGGTHEAQNVRWSWASRSQPCQARPISHRWLSRRHRQHRSACC
jgi:hypothetical protein